MQINAYLAFDGQCEEAFQFYAKTLGGEIVALHRYAGSPMTEQMPPEWGEKVMHVTMKVDGNQIMGSDNHPARGPEGAAKRFCMSIGVKDPEQAKRIFAALTEGGSVQMPIQQTFWSAAFGMGVDRFGIPWMVNCEAPQQQ